MINESACTDDFDCPVGFMCFENVSWTDKKQPFCDCNAWFGWTGQQCNEFGITTYFIFLISTMQGAVAFVLFCLGSVDIIRASFTLLGKGRTLWNSTLLTHWFNTLSLLCFSLWHAFYFLEAFYPERTIDSGRLAGPEWNRTSTWARWTRPFIIITQILGVFAVMNVSLVWLEVSRAAIKMTEVRYRRYRLLMYVVEGLFVLAMVGGGVTGMLEWLAVLASPFLIGLICAMTIGRQRMVRLLEGALKYVKNDENFATPQGSMTKGPTQVELQEQRTKRMMKAIQWCSLHVIIACVLIVLSGSAFFLLTNLLADTWKEFAKSRNVSIITFVVDALPLSILYLLTTIHVYTSRSIREMIIAAQSQHPEFYAPGFLSSMMHDTEIGP